MSAILNLLVKKPLVQFVSILTYVRIFRNACFSHAHGLSSRYSAHRCYQNKQREDLIHSSHLRSPSENVRRFLSEEYTRSTYAIA